MTIDELREYCLKKPGVEESMPFGNDTLVFKVFDKMFALCRLDSEELRVNLKCDPELSIQLRGEYPAILPGYHMNKKHWNTVVVDGSLPKGKLQEMIDHSYKLVWDKLPAKLKDKIVLN